MNAGTNSRFPGAGILLKIVVLILLIVALYYLYDFLFGTGDLESKTIINGIMDAHNSKKPRDPIVIKNGDDIPNMYEGGEYSVNFWVYINSLNAYGKAGVNKHVLTVGGTNKPTILIYLGKYSSKLSVRIKTDPSLKDPTGSSSSTSSRTGPQPLDDNATNEPCDIPSIDMQKWVQVTVTLNNKTCDVYIDGKLARSCVLPRSYLVRTQGLAIEAAKNGGFGGFMSNLTAYNYALNPEQVWRLYMNGPGPQYTLMDYLKSLFSPKSLGSFDFPKQNLT
jgi:hypothetical protein